MVVLVHHRGLKQQGDLLQKALFLSHAEGGCLIPKEEGCQCLDVFKNVNSLHLERD